MEDSMNDDRISGNEESGWTSYFDDFFVNTTQNNVNVENYSSFSSDAASLVMNNSDANHRISVDNYNFITLKKRKTRGPHHNFPDDALEDTATSPVNSPKVYDQLNKNRKQRDHAFNINSEEKVNMGSSRSEDDDDNVGLIIGRERESSELQKRGLCLVPLSMVANYFA
ncbi:vascular-related unknown protein 4-like [Euphorbia lathyris]|uniref:vascular-related unknown protein 4-like n=1 Tax=Euphorbia lathyris TaxID=212925 RepID=UPI0033130BFA